jgi:hypothetical protein
MRRFRTFGVRAALLTLVGAAVAAWAADPLPDPWKDKDVGDCGTAGSAVCKDAKWTVKASGGDIWDQADAFHFVYQTIKGDGCIMAKVTSLDNTNEWAKAGVMFREKLEPGSKHAMCVTTPANQSHMQWRPTADDASQNADAVGDNAPYWVKIERKGDKFTASVSKDGKDWASAGDPQTVEMPKDKDIYVGLAVTAHDNGQVTTAVFENVTVTK